MDYGNKYVTICRIENDSRRRLITSLELCIYNIYNKYPNPVRPTKGALAVPRERNAESV